MNTVIQNGQKFVQITWMWVGFEGEGMYDVELFSWNTTSPYPIMTQEKIDLYTEGVDYSAQECYSDIASSEVYPLIEDILFN